MKNETLADQLKQETLSAHQALEKTLVLRMRGMRSAADYITLLQIFYGYFGALEEQINKFIGTPQLPDHLLRRKTESLVQDIQYLVGTLPEKATYPDIPLIADHLQAFGALYVIEGSTLGGQIISNMIGKQLQLSGDGLSFFKSYGDDTNAMWDSFKLILNQQGNTPQEKQTVISAADDTFVKFKAWLDKY